MTNHDEGLFDASVPKFRPLTTVVPLYGLRRVQLQSELKATIQNVSADCPDQTMGPNPRHTVAAHQCVACCVSHNTPYQGQKKEVSLASTAGLS